jgi:hypothetical protein
VTQAFVMEQQGRGGDLAASLSEAEKRHKEAEDALGEMEAAIKSAVTAVPRRLGRGRLGAGGAVMRRDV